MAAFMLLSTASPFSSLALQGPKRTPKTVFSISTSKTNFKTSLMLSRRSMAHKEDVSPGSDVETNVENYRKIPFSDVVVVGKKREFWERKWKAWDVTRVVIYSSVHLLSLLAPFHFNWAAFRVAFALHLITGFGITLSYHRNLSHRSFNLPKWLEYFFAFCGMLALQGDPIEWVSNHRYHHQHCDTQYDPHSPKDGFWFSHFLWAFDTSYIEEKCGGFDNATDLMKQPFYRLLQQMQLFIIAGFVVLLYLWGGLPFLVWGMGVRTVYVYHGTFMVNSVSHICGKRVWKTNDLSKNNWWLAIVTLGEGWHNNHHAFEYSARHGLEWWQIDFTWYFISFLQLLRIATEVKLPSEVHKQNMALDM